MTSGHAPALPGNHGKKACNTAPCVEYSRAGEHPLTSPYSVKCQKMVLVVILFILFLISMYFSSYQIHYGQIHGTEQFLCAFSVAP